MLSVFLGSCRQCMIAGRLHSFKHPRKLIKEILKIRTKRLPSLKNGEKCKNTWMEIGKCVFPLGFTGVSLRLLFIKSASCQSRENVRPTENEPQFNWHVLLELIKPHLLHLIIAIVSALATAFLNIQIPLGLGKIVNLIESLMKNSEQAQFIGCVKNKAFTLVALYALQAGFTFTYIWAMACVAERMAAKLRGNLFDSLVRQEIAFFDKHRTGELLNRLTTDVQDFKSGFKQCMSQGLRSITQIVGCGLSLYFISPLMTKVMMVVIPSIVGIGYLLGRGLRNVSQAAQAQVAVATEIAEETLGNFRTVRSFAMETNEHSSYSCELENSRRLNEKLGLGIGIFQGLSNLALNGIVLGTLCLGGYMVSSGDLSGGDLMAFLVATQTIQKSLAQGSLLFGHFMRGMTAGARVFEYLEREPCMPLRGGSTIPYHSFIGNVEFKNVNFSYPTRPDQIILDDFSLKIPHGKVVALVGPSGNGKSTVAALIERFYEIDGGEITIDGVNIQSLDPSWLRGRIVGYINQEPVLFAMTVMENIRYGCVSATDEQVIEAAKIANADSFIREFPQGYKTIVGERGVTVSGGQKQRIAIARALLKDPHILLLDEATSALDAASESEVQIALEAAMRGRTTLIIAHRLSTIQNADSIAVVLKGKVVELGTHESLKRKRKLYWNLIKQQQENESSRSL